MAIYPVHSNYIIDVDIITTTSFKAGMVLMRDDNGRAVPADSQQLLNKTIQQKLGKFLGFAASDHDITGLTIIEPDTISSSWLDNNRNFQRFENLEVSHIRRSIKEHFDPNFNIDNPTDRSTVYKRGIGVYNQQGEIYITDQFNPVLHGDYGIDSSTVTTISPGDLLTFGGGINAGKLVKVNTSSNGPDVFISGVVEKYIPETGLLHFRQVSYGLSFGNSTLISYDAANLSSYPRSGTTWFNLASTNYNMSLVNGPTYSSAYSGEIAFDGTDDYGLVSGFSLSNFTIEMFVNVYQLTGTLAVNRIFETNQVHLALGSGGSFPLNSIYLYVSVSGWNNTFYTLTLGQYTHITITKTGTSYQVYINGNSIYTATLFDATITYMQLTTGGFGERTRSSFGYLNIYNKAFTATEVLNSYNFHKSRFGL